MKVNAKEFVCSAISSIINWIPFIFFTDLAFGHLYPSTETMACTIMGTLATPLHRYHLILFVVQSAAFILTLKLVAWIGQRSFGNTLSSMKQLLIGKRDELLLDSIHRLFPNTTKVVHGGNGSLLIIGSSHVSSSSALQCYDIIKRVKPDFVVLELDRKRADNLFLCNERDVQINLIRDLFDIETWKDPIVLSMRFANRMLRHGINIGMEFKMAASAAWSLKNQCQVIWGDQDMNTTIHSIRGSHSSLSLGVCYMICIFPWIINVVHSLHGFLYWMTQFVFVYHNPMAVFLAFSLGYCYWVIWTLATWYSIQIVCRAMHIFRDLSRSMVNASSFMFPFIANVLAKPMSADRNVVLCNNLMAPFRNNVAPGQKRRIVVGVVGIGHLQYLHQSVVVEFQKMDRCNTQCIGDGHEH